MNFCFMLNVYVKTIKFMREIIYFPVSRTVYMQMVYVSRSCFVTKGNPLKLLVFQPRNSHNVRMQKPDTE